MIPVLAIATPAVERLAGRWLAGFASPNTRRSYGSDLTLWLTYCAETGVDPLTAGAEYVSRWVEQLAAADQRPRTVARRLAAVASWYRFLVGENVRPDSPTAQLPRPTVPDRAAAPTLTRADVARLHAAAALHSGTRGAALLHLLATTGLRVSEILDRDIEHLGMARGRPVLRLADEAAVLTAPVARALEAHLDGRTSGPLFTTRTGRRMGQPDAWRTIRMLARRAGIEDVDAVNPRSLQAAARV